MRILYILLITSILGGCVNNSSKKNKYYQTIVSWRQKELVIPDSLKFYYFDGDSTEKICIKSLNTLKIVSFINGSCPDCILELNNWHIFTEEIKNYNLKHLIIVHYNDLMQFKSNLLAVDFKGPFILDKYNKIFENNNLPEEKIFHCLLLDQQNKTILIGNPTFSQKMRDLYLEQIEFFEKKISL